MLSGDGPERRRKKETGRLSARTLEIRLQSLQPVQSPRADLEQYATPAQLATLALIEAKAQGDIEGKSILEPGCGAGLLTAGALLLGASSALSFDIASNSIQAARLNRESLDATGKAWEIIQGQVEPGPSKGNPGFLRDGLTFDTCIMNPPFGCQSRHADVPFLELAMARSAVVYSFHMASTQEYISALVARQGGRITSRYLVKFELPHMFGFHKKRMAIIETVLVRIQVVN